MATLLPRYDSLKSYEWNYNHAPEPVQIDVPEISAEWSFCGLKTNSPLGVPAGPLLNGNWVLYYASLGFDVLTYKTVRSIPRECFPLPNLQPVTMKRLTGKEKEVQVAESMQGSWAVSFGMPSKSPEVWRNDLERTRKKLNSEKLLSVSVVGTVKPDWSLEDLANDYARCALWAVDSGADAIECNFSCPNVSTSDGQLYQQAEQAAFVSSTVREKIGSIPLVIKIGHVTEQLAAEELLVALNDHVDGIALTNSVACRVRDADASLLFNGEPRGICGKATLEASLQQLDMFHETVERKKLNLKLIGVGGASSAEDVNRYLNAGAESVHIATAAMQNPLTAVQIRETWNTKAD